MNPTILIIIGITGDLSTRKLLPAVEQIVAAGAAPKDLRIVGISRRNISKQEIVKRMAGVSRHNFIAEHLDMYQMDLTRLADYENLKKYLAKLEKSLDDRAQYLFYLSVPPQISQPIVELLGASGLNQNSKLLLEKPFGVDLDSAKDLIKQTKKYFAEEQIYRIDHFLAKEMAQNLIVFRGGNSLFKRTWSKDFIKKIEIIASEKIGIEGRVSFYEQTGALRDLVQSHLLQLAALTLMPSPKIGETNGVPALRLKALKQLNIPNDKPLEQLVKRGQYASYQAEVNNQDSRIETYVELTLQSEDPNWAGVPIHILTGKALYEKSTQIRITYKKDEDHEANILIIKLQPNEGVELHLWTKVPGYSWKVEKHSLELRFKEHFRALPQPYEQVLLDAINSNHVLFASSEEVLETWRIIEPIQNFWAMSEAEPLTYEPGSRIGKIDLSA